MSSDKHHGTITVNGHSHDVTWHTISGEVYVHCRNWWYAGKAHNMDGALDVAHSYLRRQGWELTRGRMH